jgi:hypothetical protein
MPTYAYGKRAFGFCDRCGQRYDLHVLKRQIYNQVPLNLLVCPECLDVDNPQLQLGKYPVVDPIALRNPRPDVNIQIERGLFGWQYIEGLPEGSIAGIVGNPATFIQSYLGTAYVHIEEPE